MWSQVVGTQLIGNTGTHKFRAEITKDVTTAADKLNLAVIVTCPDGQRLSGNDLLDIAEYCVQQFGRRPGFCTVMCEVPCLECGQMTADDHVASHSGMCLECDPRPAEWLGPYTVADYQGEAASPTTEDHVFRE